MLRIRPNNYYYYCYNNHWRSVPGISENKWLTILISLFPNSIAKQYLKIIFKNYNGLKYSPFFLPTVSISSCRISSLTHEKGLARTSRNYEYLSLVPNITI